MKIGLLAMSGVRVKSAELAELGVTLPGFVRRGKVIASLPSLGLLTVAALTPPRHEVTYLEIVNGEDIALLPAFDLVGISSLTAQIDQAYQVAEVYRSRGTKVVMGGLHVSQMPDEALIHTDSVVVNGAEKGWQTLLHDVEQDNLKSIYSGATNEVFEPNVYAIPRFDLLRGRLYNRLTIQTSRGCPRGCEFCAASLRITERFNQKPVDLVMREIDAALIEFPEGFFEFADDNTFLNKQWSKEFLKALQRKEVSYFTETDASIADDPGLCDLLSESGCKQLLIGFESHRPDDLERIDDSGWKKTSSNRADKVIDTIQSRGVSVNGCFILGLDNHTPDIFEDVLQFVRRSGLAEVQITVLTPFPETPLYHRLKAEGRLLKEKFWDACTLFDVNYVPKQMSVKELEEGLKWLFAQLYSVKETSARSRHFAEQRMAFKKKS